MTSGLSATVLVVTRDRRDRLRTALSSCVLQDCAPEVLVIDDASTDGTYEMVTREFPQVRIERSQAPLGCPVQRNRGIAMASGEIVVCLDDDAWFSSPRAVRQTLDSFDDPRIGVVTIPYMDIRRSRSLLQAAPDPGRWEGGAFSGGASAFRRSTFIDSGGYPAFDEHGEETDLAVRLLDRGVTIRLGAADHVVHDEHAVRKPARTVAASSRNHLLTVWRTVPMPYLPVRWTVVTVKVLLVGMQVGRPGAAVRGIAEAVRACASGRVPRAPVRRRTYVVSRRLLRRGPRKIAEAVRPASPRRIRVVYLDHTAKLSGGELALLRLLPHLDGVDAHVILAEDGPLRPRLEEVGVTVEVLPMPDGSRDLRKDRVRPGLQTVRPALATLRYAWQLSRRLRALGPDLVHANSLKSGVYGCVAGRLAGVPVVWHVRDRIAADYLPEPAVRGLRLMLRHLPAAVIVNSRATMATVGTADPYVVHSVVPEVIQVADMRERPAGDEAFRVGIVGRLAPWKGQDLFLRAFAAAFPDGDERAVIVGAAMFGEDDYADGLPELARALGIADRVEFRGFRDDVPAELARLQILVHASLTAEPFGQVILEGMASGVPVVATAGGGPSEIITTGVSGLLFTAGDVGALAQLLRTLRADEALRDRLAAGGLDRARDFSPAVASARVLDVYRGVLG